MTSVSQLDLDLDIFQGPFDLLLAVVLREEVSLSDVALGDVVVAYLERLEETGELDLDAATEFLVLIAALLELKSRLLLPAEEDDEEFGPEEAADELLARMLEYRRYRDASRVLGKMFAAEAPYLYRSAPLPPELRRAALKHAKPVYDPNRLGSALGELLTPPPQPNTSHIRPTVSLQRRLGVLREALRRGKRLDFGETFGNEDRLTQAVTLFALLEMHRRGEATWSQNDTFGAIEVTST
ncbi:MAG: ScpA family protein [Solirubrobacterales bacterium]